MIQTVILLILILYVPKVVAVPYLNTPLFVIRNNILTLYHFLIFLLTLWIIAVLPKTFRGFTIVFLVIWIAMGILFYFGFNFGGGMITLPDIFWIKK